MNIQQKSQVPVSETRNTQSAQESSTEKKPSGDQKDKSELGGFGGNFRNFNGPSLFPVNAEPAKPTISKEESDKRFKAAPVFFS